MSEHGQVPAETREAWAERYRTEQAAEHQATSDRIGEILEEIRSHGPDREISWDAGDEEIELLVAAAGDREAIRLLISDQVEAALRIHAETDNLDYTVDILTEDGKIAIQFQGPREGGRREISILGELEFELEPETLGVDEIEVVRGWRWLFACAVAMCDEWFEREAPTEPRLPQVRTVPPEADRR